MGKPLFTLIILFCLLSFNTKAQKWLWANIAVNNSNTSFTRPTGITIDPRGNIIETGEFIDSVNFGSFALGAYNKAFEVYNGYIVKYDPTGKILWAMCGKESEWKNINSLAITSDAAGNIFLTGSGTDSITFGLQSFSIGNGGYFLAKFDPNGNVQWVKGSTQGNGESAGQSVAVDPMGHINVSGYYIFQFKVGSFSLPSPPTSVANVFIAQYDQNGNVIWAQNSNNQNVSASWTQNDLETAITCDKNGNVYVDGTYNDTINFGSYKMHSYGTSKSSLFLAKYDSAGNLQWATGPTMLNSSSNITESAGSGYDLVTLCTDTSNNIYVTGGYGGSIRFASYTLSKGTYFGIAFLVKFDPAGNVIWAKTAIPSNSNDMSFGRSIVADKWNHLYWAGNMHDSITFNGQRVGGNWFDDAYIMKLDLNGNILCQQPIRDASNALNQLVAADPLGPSAYFVSSFQDSAYIGSFAFAQPYYFYTGYSLAAKWTCSTCGIAVNISGKSAICNGQGTWLKGGAGVGYIWNTGVSTDSIFVSPNTTTTYTLYQSDGICSGDTTFTVTVKPFPIPAINGTQKICYGNSTILTASGGSAYIWSNGDTTSSIIVTPLSSTNYTVTVSNGTCSVNDSVNVMVYDYPLPVVSNRQVICLGKSASLSASGGTTYVWSNGDTTNSVNVSPSSTTTYTVILYNGPCPAKDSIAVVVNSLPNAQACCDTTINSGQSVHLASGGGVKYSWIPSNNLSCDTCSNPTATPLQNTTYTLIVTSDSGCSVTTTITIDVSCNIFIPEAFSPNGDGQNDVLYVRGDCIKTMQFDVFDRWGNRIFETTNKNIGWNGMYKGEAMNTGSYVYSLSATMYDGTTITKKGNVALVR
ncbi:MAG TPA: gliding motility-associated C-terminal domain-containing protein [Bacteroidia bacterium]|jgi:gliding motility-associated-like protein|nr:gliding motility-associated C-terminal domain-containing protein [Bacteroidia bacterium]